MKDQMQKPMYESKKTVEVTIHGNNAGTEEQQHSKRNQGLSKVVSLRDRLESRRKSKLWVFMFGHGTAKFPTKMELNDIKSRQLRQQTATTLSDGGEDEIPGRRSGDKRWWRLIDVFGCGGGYNGDNTVIKDLRASFRTLEKYDTSPTHHQKH